MASPYNPLSLPPQHLAQDLVGFVAHISKANRALARYDGLLEGLINPQVMLSPLLMKEAELSSKIEGTIATANEVYQQQAGVIFEPEKQADIHEIVNYRRTLRIASEQVDKTTPLTLHLIRQMHSELMQGVRGQKKNPGKFRTTQNWIGEKGCSIDEAIYIPPAPVTLQDHLDSLNQFLSYEASDIDPVSEAALVHAQFELIHPFDDGNGRIGRLLIPLFLAQRGVLSSPSFYISRYLESNRDEYYFRLNRISENGEWQLWIAFFLDAVISQAERNANLIRRIAELYESTKHRIATLLHSDQSIFIADFLFDTPVFRATDLHQRLNIQRQRAAKYLRAMKKHEILTEVRAASGKRAAMFSFEALWNITDRQ
jgi:Fic family protein